MHWENKPNHLKQTQGNLTQISFLRGLLNQWCTHYPKKYPWSMCINLLHMEFLACKLTQCIQWAAPWHLHFKTPTSQPAQTNLPWIYTNPLAKLLAAITNGNHKVARHRRTAKGGILVQTAHELPETLLDVLALVGQRIGQNRETPYKLKRHLVGSRSFDSALSHQNQEYMKEVQETCPKTVPRRLCPPGSVSL